MQPINSEKIERMLARDEIREVLANYARGVDRGDGALLKSCYHSDAIEEHGGAFSGNAFNYVDGAIPRILKLGPMQHLLGSTHIDFEDPISADRAVTLKAYVETYIWTLLRVTTQRGELDTFTGGRLIDRFERRGGDWKIAHRRTIFDWNRDTPSQQGWVNGMFTPGTPGMLQGCKGAADPSYERF